MLENAKKQFKEISLEQIKEIIKKLVPAKYDKMIINENSNIDRADYYYSELNYKVAERDFHTLTFPLFDKDKNTFSKYEGGVNKFGEKAYIQNPSDVSNFLKLEGLKNLNVSLSNPQEAFDFPLIVKDKNILDTQLPFFYAKNTYSQRCEKCNGNQYVTCSNCNGVHRWQCPSCSGAGKITCSKCSGHGYNKCRSCSGKGYKMVTEFKDGRSYQRKEKCTTCMGKGETPCKKCGTTGQIKCNKCSGKGEIICSVCYGDKNRYGMVDCPECLTAGITAQFAFTTTKIKNLTISQINNKGKDIGLDTEKLKEHYKDDLKFKTIYKNINGEIYDELDEISDQLIKSFEKELEFSKNNYPMILQEDIIYQIIPCVKVSYKHMLTNSVNELTIVNFWDNPDIIFYSDAEKIKTNVKSVSKSAKGFFSKVLKTKKHKEKEDRKTEINLMIYLAKSDGKIEDEEKEFLADQISHLDDFTNSEKKGFFNLMNSVDLPELTIKDLNFTNEQKATEIIEKLVQLANSDGEYELAEKKLIEKIKNLIKEKFQ